MRDLDEGPEDAEGFPHASLWRASACFHGCSRRAPDGRRVRGVDRVPRPVKCFLLSRLEEEEEPHTWRRAACRTCLRVD